MAVSLFRDALTYTRLFEAWLKVRANHGAPGIDGVTLDAFERKLAENLKQLQRDAVRSEYRPSPLLAVDILEEEKKPRHLAIPTVRDRVIQTAVALVLTPIFEAEFEDASFAYRRGRSVKRAVERVLRYRDLGFRWVVDADISAFFDNIDHALLLKAVREVVSDARILALIEQWIRTEVVVDGVAHPTSKGVPQGSPISPLLANLYLDRLDEVLLAENLRLVRYADDFLILCKDRPHAEEALEITEDLLATLHLRLNTTKTRIVNFDHGFRFLGVTFVRSLAFKSEYDDGEIGRIDAAEDHVAPASVEPTPPTTSVPPPPARADDRRDMPPPRNEIDPPALPSTPEQRTGASDTVLAAAFAAAGWKPGETREHPHGADESTANVNAADFRDAEQEPPSPERRRDPLLRTLYLLEHGCVLSREGDRLVVSKEGEALQEVHAHSLDLVMVFGTSVLTVPAMRLCLAEQIPVALLSDSGRFFGCIDCFGTDAVELHRAQFERAADPAFCLRVAKALVGGKIDNSRLVLRRYARNRPSSEVDGIETTIRDLARQVKTAKTLDELRGYEGASAKRYFDALARLLPPEWQFQGRTRQPPAEPVNALLSYGYALLYHNVHALLRARGLNPHVGFLHPPRTGHPALVSDLIEEFRAITVDALVLNLISRRRVTPEDFERGGADEPGCRIGEAARKLFIHAFEARMRETISHPASVQPLDYRRCIDAQVRRLAAVIRGTEAEYVAMTPR